MNTMDDPFQLFLNNDMDFTSFTDFHSKPIDTVLLEGMQVPSLHAFDQVDYDITNNYHQFPTPADHQFIFNNEIPVVDHPSSPFTIMSSSPKSSNASIQMVASPEHQPMASPATASINTTLLVPSVPSILPITDISNTTTSMGGNAGNDIHETSCTITSFITPIISTTTSSSSTTRSTTGTTSQSTTTKKNGKPKGRKRRTAQDLPYALNLLNLNLAPSKRNTRITHNNNNNNGSSTQRSPTPFRCDFPGCEKTFTRPYNLKSHRRTHTAERPFECNVCSKRFARQHDRNRHTKLHFGIKPYICHLCNKAFARQDALNRHQRPDSNKGASYPISSCASTGHRQRQPRKKNNVTNK